MYQTIENAQKAVLQAVRDMVDNRLVASTWGNVSARVQNTDCVVITPSGVDYRSLSHEDLPVIDMDGEQKAGKYQPSSEKHLHLALYRRREDIHGIMHTHSVFASAFSVIREPIPPMIEDMIQIAGGEVPVAPYFLPGSRELGDGVAMTLGSDLSAVLMANHGMVGVGRDVHEAFKVCLVVEKAAHIYHLARTLGKPHVLSQEDVDIMRRQYLHSYSKNDREEWSSK